MENIHVALRVRPLSKRELSLNDASAWNLSSFSSIRVREDLENELVIKKRITTQTKTEFYYDYCFGENSTNDGIYDTVIKRIVMSSLNGINGTVFMYGQTGSGKTFTMLGSNNIDSKDKDDVATPEESHIDITKRESPIKRVRSRSERRDSYLCALDHTPKEIMADHSEGNTYGILVLSLKELFQTIEDDMDKTFVLHCSYVEIYNDNIHDLLAPRQRFGEVLSIAEDGNKDFYIKGVTEESVSSIDEILEKLKKGENNRHYAKTVMNHCSSRSHTVFRLHVQTITNTFIRNFRKERRESNINNHNLFSLRNPEDEMKTEGTFVTESLLNFVDLAGSERASTHSQLSISAADGIVRDRINESKHINKSLFFLCQVISLKSENKSAHIPYRNSPLTKILRSSLGGNSRTLVMLCITPGLSQIEHSLSTLRFGISAKKIENNIHANIKVNNDDEAVRLLLNEYEKKLREFEESRKEDKQRIEFQSKRIQEISDENQKLKERLKKLQLKFFDKSFCQATIITQKEPLSSNKAGILFQTQTNLPSIPKEKQDEMFDFQGKYALAALKACKEKLQIEEEKSKILAEERNQWKYSCVFKKRQLIEFKSLLRKKEEQTKDISQLFNECLTLLTKVSERESLLSGLKGVDEVNIEDLKVLEKHFMGAFERIKASIILRGLGHSPDSIPNDLFICNLQYKDNIICSDETISSLSSRFNLAIEKKIEISIKNNDIDGDIEKKFRLRIESIDARKDEIQASLNETKLKAINELVEDDRCIDMQISSFAEVLGISKKRKILENKRQKVEKYLQKCQESRSKWLKKLNLDNHDKFSQKLIMLQGRSQSNDVSPNNSPLKNHKKNLSCSDVESELFMREYAFLNEGNNLGDKDDIKSSIDTHSSSEEYDSLTPFNIAQKFLSNFREAPSPAKKLIQDLKKRSNSLTRSFQFHSRHSSLTTPFSSFVIPESFDEGNNLEDSFTNNQVNSFSKSRNKSVCMTTSTINEKIFTQAIENYKVNSTKLNTKNLKRGRTQGFK